MYRLVLIYLSNGLLYLILDPIESSVTLYKEKLCDKYKFSSVKKEDRSDQSWAPVWERYKLIY